MSGADFWRVGYGADFARDITRLTKSVASIEGSLSVIAGMLEALNEEKLNRAKLLRRGVEPGPFSDPHEPIERLVWQTLVDRGHDPDQSAKAVEYAFSYEPFGKIVDDIERELIFRVIPEDAHEAATPKEQLQGETGMER